MVNRLLATTAAVLVVAACSETPTEVPLDRDPMTASGASVERNPFGGLIDFCGEEVVAVSGWFQVVSNLTSTPKGQFSETSKLRATGEGVGLTTGAQYRWNDNISFNGHVDATDGAPLVITDKGYLRLIGQGPAANYKFRRSYHLTVDANGVTRAEVIADAESCS